MKAFIRTTPWAVVLLFVGLFLVFISADLGQRFLQRLAFGTPASICIADVKVELDARWQVFAVQEAGRPYAMLAGVLPVSPRMAHFDGEEAQVSLKSAGSRGTVSIHRISRPESRESLIAGCRENARCRFATSALDGTSAVLLIRGESATWIHYLDRPVRIGLRGVAAGDASGIRLSSCRRTA